MKFIFKYAYLNVKLYKRIFIPMFFIFTLSLITLIYSFGINRNISSADKGPDKYLYVVGVTASARSFNRDSHAIVNNNLANSLALSNYVKDYYVVEEMPASSTTVKPIVVQNIETDNKYFKISAYSDISKSVDFTTGKRKLSDGRYAENFNECNISKTLAEKNSYELGDTLAINPWSSDVTRRFTVVGIYDDMTDEVGNEYSFLMSNYDEHSNEKNTAGILSIRRNDILTKLNSTSHASLIKFKTAIYYMNDEQALYSFKEAINKSLSSSFVALDSTGSLKFIRQISDGVRSSYFFLLIVIGIIGSIFYALLIAHSLKSRTYDIGVLRSRGMTKKDTTLLFVCEVFIVSTIAFLAAVILYLTTFTPLTNLLYEIQRYYIINYVMWNHPAGVISLSDTVRSYNFPVSLGTFEVVCSFFASVIFGIVIGTVSMAYIARNEPMKTMIEY